MSGRRNPRPVKPTVLRLGPTEKVVGVAFPVATAFASPAEANRYDALARCLAKLDYGACITGRMILYAVLAVRNGDCAAGLSEALEAFCTEVDIQGSALSPPYDGPSSSIVGQRVQ